MNMAIIGSRDFNDYEYLNKTIKEKVKELPIIKVIVSGCARGADTLGEEFARKNNLIFKAYPAMWDTYGKSAGIIRNKDIINNSDIVVAFWDGKSTGTCNSIELAKKMGKKTYIFNDWVENEK